MMLSLDLKRLLAYDDWANRETLASLEAIDSPPPGSVKLLGHIVGAEQLWYGRLRGDKPGPVWPALSLAECRATLDELSRLWADYLDALAPADLGRAVAYVNSKGEPWTSRVGDILTHVVLHSSHHRGQIASDIRAAGHAPPYTDYIHAVRQGFLPSSS
jgi:uncharacterized damage-inducible protein DinB